MQNIKSMWKKINNNHFNKFTKKLLNMQVNIKDSFCFHDLKDLDKV